MNNMSHPLLFDPLFSPWAGRVLFGTSALRERKVRLTRQMKPV